MPISNSPAPTPPPASTSSSAAKLAPDATLSTPETSVLPSAAGPAPALGPGATVASDLGDQLDSAAGSTRLPFRVTATIGEVYDNNIYAEPNKVSDYITHLAVTGEVRIGDLLAADGNFVDAHYTPSLHLYARNSHETGVDQDVGLLYAHHWTRLTLSLEQTYTKTQDTDASFGGLVTDDDYTTTALAKFAYSMKLDLIASFKQEFIDYDEPNYTNSKEWSGEFHFLYHVDPKLSVGVGPRFGYLNLEMAPDETYQQILVHAVYIYSEKLSFHGTAGAEDRQYQTYERSDTLEPIFELSGAYLPDPSTTFSINAARHFTPSYRFEGEDYLGTYVNLAATKRIFNAYYLGVMAGYENDDYQFAATGVVGPTREDNYFFVQPSLTWKPNGWLEVAAFDRYEEDSSNFDIFSYDTNQVGVSCSATY